MSDFHYTIRNTQSTVKPISLPETDNFNTCFMRDYQKPAFDTCASKRFVRVCMPTGSGKSTVAAFLLVKQLSDNPNIKAIISVPQLSIAKSHRHISKGKPTKFYLDTLPADLDAEGILDFISTRKPENSCEWAIRTDLTGSNKTEASTVKGLINFLKSKGISIASRICLCSNQTLVAGFRALEEQEQLDIIKNVIFAFDEYHHIREIYETHDNEEIDEEDFCESPVHGMGEVADFVFRNWESHNLSMFLFSATPVRGDMARIVAEKNMPLFENGTFILPFDEYMSKMIYLKSFEVRFEFYALEDGFAPVIEAALRDKNFKKTMIWLPKRQPFGNTFTVETKQKEIEQVLTGIARSHGWMHPIVTRKKKPYNSDTIIELQIAENKWVTVINVVDDDVASRKKAKQYLDSINDDYDAADYIIALEMLKEGFDWKFCDRTVTLGKNNSLNQLLQIPGRALRDVPGKERVQILFYLPIKGKSLDDTKSLEDNINDVVNAIHLSMLMYEIHEPIDIDLPTANGEQVQKIKSYDLLDKIFSSDQEKFEFDRKYQAEVMRLIINQHDEVSDQERITVIENILGSMGIDEHIIELYSEVLMRYTKVRAKKVAPLMLEGLANTKILKEVRALIKPMSEIPAELAITAFCAHQVSAPSLSNYHVAMYALNGNDNEATSRENIEKLKAYLAEHDKMPPKDSELGIWVEKVRNKQCHIKRAKENKAAEQMAQKV